MNNLRAFLAISLLALNLSFWIIPVTLLALLRLLLPMRIARRFLQQCMEWLAIAAISGDTLVWRYVSGVQIEWTAGEPPTIAGNCIVISNHQSWADILLLQHAVVYRTAPLKWLAKRELLYVPVIGLICWAYGYPMLRRFSEQELRDQPELREIDAAQVRNACAALREQPGTVMNFPEGTRYTAAKAARCESPHRYLLPPRSGGMFTLLQVMGDTMEGVLDITIQYPQTPASLWNFLGGRYRTVRMHCEYLPRETLPFLADGRGERNALRDWLEQRWSHKDRLLDGYLSP